MVSLLFFKSPIVYKYGNNLECNRLFYVFYHIFFSLFFFDESTTFFQVLVTFLRTFYLSSSFFLFGVMATAAITAYQRNNAPSDQSSDRSNLRKHNTARQSVYASLSKSIDRPAAVAVQEEEETGEHRKSKRFQDSSRVRIPQTAKCIIDPKSSFQSKWDIVMMILLVFVAVVTPYEGKCNVNVKCQPFS